MRLRHGQKRKLLAPEPDDMADLEDHDDSDADTKGQITRVPLSHPLHIDIEHHDDKQKQHHDCADIDQNQHDREKLRPHEQPEHGAFKKREDEK